MTFLSNDFFEPVTINQDADIKQDGNNMVDNKSRPLGCVMYSFAGCLVIVALIVLLFFVFFILVPYFS